MQVRTAEGKVIEVNAPDEALEVYRHSTSHLMALAVTELFPETHLGIGPAISDGFFYDFERDQPFTQEDLEKIEEKMRELVQKDLPYQPAIVNVDEAVEEFDKRGEKLKVELIKEKCGQQLSCYRVGSLVDFCTGPHVLSTGRIDPKTFKVLSLAGAYWKGDDKREQMQRIYGTAFLTEQDLQDYLHRLEEAKKRDHRRLGKDLDLFSLHEEAGAGFIYWHPKGALLRHTIESYLREELVRKGYQFVVTPHVAKIDLWKTSGHADYYRQNMYLFNIEDEEFVIKPMNCPGHITIYQTHRHSYRELPIRFAEFGTVYRYEKSGVLHGMMRVRGFTQDDAHIFCTPEQAFDEIAALIELTDVVLKTFGFEQYEVDLSVRDPNRKQDYVGEDKDWEHAESTLVQALEKKGWNYRRAEGEAVFYGPKIDLRLIDAIGRRWQATTVQYDFNLPRRFDMSYIGPDSKSHPVIMIHRAIFGSLERFIGILLEHYAGALPIWLAPVQAVILPISDKFHAYAREVLAKLQAANLRVHFDDRNEKVNYKIREAQLQKIPYMLVVGGREAENGTVAVRNRFQGDEGAVPTEQFIQKIKTLIEEKATKP
jgi:threonyl-tRNA synthetase